MEQYVLYITTATSQKEMCSDNSSEKLSSGWRKKFLAWDVWDRQKLRSINWSWPGFQIMHLLLITVTWPLIGKWLTVLISHWSWRAWGHHQGIVYIIYDQLADLDDAGMQGVIYFLERGFNCKNLTLKISGIKILKLDFSCLFKYKPPIVW